MCRNANIPIYKKNKRIKEEEVFLKSALWGGVRKVRTNDTKNRTKCSNHSHQVFLKSAQNIK